MAVNVVLDKALDKAYENKPLAEILSAPPSALAGFTEAHDKVFAELKIKTIADLGNNKYFRLAAVLTDLAKLEG
ncbi:hypothetical protein [Nocardia farcinica]|uniref:hypothetical protein n=1 Tax=Nocardia farcinica TaxID=37329 RepID=UPI0002E0A55F|nr:hypothetical protein [Nocardia farcinica]MBF6386108.1 hypothetical protein [Nocardia farcinica]MBF6538710.1 hypothetical protein [Nocardia farcinica]MBF6572499.1 hypothetical protein [Nocardia farcinica]